MGRLQTGQIALAVLAAVLAMAVLATPAVARSAGEDGSAPVRASAAGEPAGEPVGEPVEEIPAAEEDSGFPPVPLNGIDAIALILVALSLLGAGVALRRLSTR